MAVAKYQVRINEGTPIDAGDVLTYTATGLGSGVLNKFEVRAVDDTGNPGPWSVVYETADYIGRMLVDDDGNAIVDDDGNAIIIY